MAKEKESITSEETEKPPILLLPYVEGVSEKIEIACKRMGVRTVFKSNGTLRKALTKVKTKTTNYEKTGVVYRIPCQDCKASYVGETKRTLQKRITEHKYAVKNNDRNNGIAVHAWDKSHRPDWEAAEILEVEPQHTRRRVLEAIWIKNTPEACNLDCGMNISEVWSTLT